MALTTACTSPGYNDNPSQQMSTARIGCPAAAEFFAVYFSVHLQPFNEDQGVPIKREIFRPYCNDLPTPGRVFLTADLVGAELRTMPIGLRIRQRASADDESSAEDVNAVRTIFEVPAKTYANGVIEADFELDEQGYYAIDLIRRGEDPAAAGDRLTIPLNVGVDAGGNVSATRIFTLVGAASALALMGFAASRLWRRGPGR